LAGVDPGRKPNRPSAHQVIPERVREEADAVATRLIELAKDGKAAGRAAGHRLAAEVRGEGGVPRGAATDRLRLLSRHRLIAEVVHRLRSMEEAGWTSAPPERLVVERGPVRELSPPREPCPTPPYSDD
jgi:hypothetical protein